VQQWGGGGAESECRWIERSEAIGLEREQGDYERSNAAEGGKGVIGFCKNLFRLAKGEGGRELRGKWGGGAGWLKVVRRG